MQRTNIGWTDYSTNPLRATNRATGKAGHFCEKVSPGCAHCYASEWNEKRGYGTGVAYLPANRDQVGCWLNEAELQEWQKPKYAGSKVFVADMTDLFGEWVPDYWLAEIFGAAAMAYETAQEDDRQPLTLQILTKRPARARQLLASDTFFEDVVEVCAGKYGWGGTPSRWPLPNVWLGVSVENQRWTTRIEDLLATPAAKHFVSLEPLLGPIDLCYCGKGAVQSYEGPKRDCWLHGEQALNWVIVGAESGPRRRPMQLSWLLDIAAQCQAAGVACWVKQDSSLRPGQQGRIPDDVWALKELP